MAHSVLKRFSKSCSKKGSTLGIVRIGRSLPFSQNLRNYCSSPQAKEFIENVVKRKLEDALKPDFLEVINESAKHNVPRGSASHIRVTIVSSLFDKKSLVQKHRLVNSALQEELRGPIHALSINAFAPVELKEEKIETSESPPCRGGSGMKK